MANRGRHKKPITPEEIVAYFSFRGGASRDKIAEVLNINPMTVSRWAGKVKRWLGKWANEEDLQKETKRACALMLPLALEGLRCCLFEKDSSMIQFYFKYVCGFTEKQEIVGGNNQILIIRSNGDEGKVKDSTQAFSGRFHL